MAHWYIDHIHVDIGIGSAAVPVGAGFTVFFRVLQVLFFDDLLALDHAATTVRTIVFALLTGRAAAGAALIVLDFGSGDLLLVLCGAFALTSETKSSSDPAYKLEDQNDLHYKYQDQNKHCYYA